MVQELRYSWLSTEEQETSQGSQSRLSEQQGEGRRSAAVGS